TTDAAPAWPGADVAALPVVPIRSGAPAPAPALVTPQALRLPTLGVSAEVVPVGLRPDGEVEVPADVRTVGWYRYGADLAADAGSVVVVGHVDNTSQGPGAFWGLRTLEVGDPVSVQASDGSTRTFTVVAREQWSKGEVPLDRVFSAGGQPRLTLVTCGGSFDGSRASYRDNVVVTAVEQS
ncbi:MAG: class F sortase, partial [Pseudorhodobacter sp.]|nr:class F sortase [Frankiaceae bacterium]